ncbi:alpha/beta hydrolase [Nocardiopsis sp. CNS-639]|uniref:alpha/beta hydrolase n=1 Tax=Nocardiopsis sp. CNS-639 TaxID=1169153 RepID=UPI00035DD9AF|nr:alpha/beta hydrolase [Nocardiopsis sp. CNS-639]
MVWVACVLAGIALFFAAGTVAWQTPWLGLLGSLGGYVPGWLVVAAVLGFAAGVAAWVSTPSIWAVVSAAVSVWAAAVGIRVIADQRRVLADLGVSTRFRDYFGPHRSSTTGPDEVVTYGPVDGFTPRMGVYRPEPGVSPAPVVVHVHGGGWEAGDETSDAWFARHLAEAGFLVFTPTYTYAAEGRPTWDLAPQQIACALVEARALSERYGGDPGRFHLTGSSAGGNLAPLVANRLAAGETFGRDSDSLPDITAIAITIPAVDPGFAEGNAYVPAGTVGRRLVRAFLGGTPDQVPERYEAVDAGAYLDAKCPPALVVYGPNDWLVPAQAILNYILRARLRGAQVRPVAIPWTGHLMGLSGAADRAIAQLTVEWFNAHAPRS